MPYICNVFHEFANSMIPYEENLFLWLNGHHNAFFDTFMSIYSGKVIWIPFLLAAIGVLCFKTKKNEAILAILAIALVCVFCDQLASSVIRPLCERFRPTHYPGIENLVHTVNGYTGGKYGFISAHSANGFGIATISALLFRYRPFTYVIFLWATITAYSRIYLGVHFISDVLGGMLVGISVGFFVYWLYTKARIRFLQLSPAESRISPFEPWRANILIYTFAATVFVLVIISGILS